MPKIIAPKQYKGYLSEWDTLGLGPAPATINAKLATKGGFSLLQFGKALRDAGYPKDVVHRIFDIQRKNPGGVRGFKNLIKHIKKVVSFDEEMFTGYKNYTAHPENTWGFSTSMGDMLAYRTAGYINRAGKSLTKEEIVDLVLHELEHVAHTQLVRDVIMDRIAKTGYLTYRGFHKVKAKDVTQSMIDEAVGWGTKQRGRTISENIAETGSATKRGVYRNPFKMLHEWESTASEKIGGMLPKSVQMQRAGKQSIVRSHQIYKTAIKRAAKRPVEPISGFLDRGAKRLLLPHLKP